MVIGSNVLKDLFPERGKLGPASVDMTLADRILVPRSKTYAVRLGGRMKYKPVHFSKQKPFILIPGGFVLAATNEAIDLPSNVCAFVQGRSSIGRIGLSVQNAGFIDAGFHGTITLELKNDGRQPIALIPGYRVAQLVALDVRDNDRLYDGKYNGQLLPTGSRMYMDEEAWK